MTQLTGKYHETSNQHAELAATRITCNNDDLEEIQLWIDNHNPFDENEQLLRSIATGLSAVEGDGINCDQAAKVGQAIQDHF